MEDYNLDQLNNTIEDMSAAHDPNRKGNLPAALLAAAAGCLAIAAVWAFICILTEKEWVFMGIFAGIAIGWIVKVAGRGRDITMGVIGAVFGLLSCVFGEFFSLIGFLAEAEETDYFQTLTSFDYSNFFDLLFVDFNYLSLVIWGIAAFEGFKVARSA